MDAISTVNRTTAGIMAHFLKTLFAIQRTPFLLLFLTISGFTSLGYQLTWIRVSAIAFGSTTSALSTVTAAFFAGMAIGAYLFGRILKGSSKRLLLIYGVLEISIGLTAWLTLALLQWANAPFGEVYRIWGGNSPILLPIRTLMIFGMILPASILIGGVFPLISQIAANSGCCKPRTIEGVLYASNTMGAFVGCIISGMILIPETGIAFTTYTNCGISIMIGIAAIIVRKAFIDSIPGNNSFSPQRQPAHLPVFDDGATSSGLPRIAMYLLFAMTGFTAIGFEVIWTRFLSLIIHTTAFTYIFSLAAILIGITIGSLLAPQLPRKHALLIFGIANILIGISVAWELLRPVAMWDWIYDSKSLFQQAILCISVFLIPSILMGVSFPLAMVMVKTDVKTFGRNIGSLISLNTLGGIAGALSVGYFILPIFGLHTSILFLTSCSVVIGCAAVLAPFQIKTIIAKLGMCACGLGMWLLIGTLSETRLPDSFLGRHGTLIEVTEGATSFLSVLKSDGTLRLEIDGMWQGQKSKDYQIMAAHIPMLLHTAPKRILVIGVGTGQTARRFLMYDIDTLDCADIESGLPELIRRHFDGKWLDDPRVRYIHEDGRTVVSYTRSTYDVISIEAGQAFRASAAALYTSDFYTAAAGRLNRNGLVCQFIPIGFYSKQELSSVIRSFITVFPYSTLWFNKYAELILIGSAQTQPRLTAHRLSLIESDTVLFNDLSYSLRDNPAEKLNQTDFFIGNYLMGPQGLSKIAEGGIMYRDDCPELEYRTAVISHSPARFHQIIEEHLEDPLSCVDSAMRARVGTRAARIQRENIHAALSR